MMLGVHWQPSQRQACPARDMWEEFHRGRIDATLLEVLSSHLQDCSRCLAVMDAISSRDSQRQPGATSSPFLGEENFSHLRTRASKLSIAMASLGTENAARLQRSIAERIPENLGRYNVRRLLGAGGFGQVYLADDPILKHSVAIRVLRRQQFESMSAMFDFLDKVRMAAALCHPMIVPILEIGVRGNNAGYAMIVMKHIEGRTLADASRRTPLPIPKAVSLVAQIARAVDYAHGQGCLHLNLKPSNILLDSRGHALIADFGFGPDIRGLNSAFVGSRGTPPYMAPELVQRDFRAIDRKTDVWALAIMLVELVTQQRRCQDGRSSHQVERILHSDLELPVEMDTELLRIVRQCLEKTPSRRTATALQFAEQIESWLANHPTDSAESPFPRKYRILFAIACAVVIGVLVLNVLFRQ